MDDHQIAERITALVAEEHALREQHGAGELGAPERERLRSLEVELDQCWDLLRQRRARREFGSDPDAAAVRDASVVEDYKQ